VREVGYPLVPKGVFEQFFNMVWALVGCGVYGLKTIDKPLSFWRNGSGNFPL